MPSTTSHETLVDVIYVCCPDGTDYEFEFYKAEDKFVFILHPNRVNSHQWVTELERRLQYPNYLVMGEGKYKLVCSSDPRSMDPKLFMEDELFKAKEFFGKRFPGAAIHTYHAVFIPYRPGGTILVWNGASFFCKSP